MPSSSREEKCKERQKVGAKNKILGNVINDHLRQYDGVCLKMRTEMFEVTNHEDHANWLAGKRECRRY